MKGKLLHILAIILLLFNGFGALYGGVQFILHPDGSTMGISVAMLRHSPFADFRIPGVVLLLVNCIGSFAVLNLLIMYRARYAWALILEGVLLEGWILIQMLLLRTTEPLQIVYGLVGLAMVVIGCMMYYGRHK